MEALDAMLIPIPTLLGVLVACSLRPPLTTLLPTYFLGR